MKAPLIAALLALSAAPALAETQLERMERITETLQARMFADMVQGSDIDVAQAVAWDDAMRDAAQCLLDGYRAEAEPDAIDASFDAMEELLAQTDLGADEFETRMAALPQPVPQDRAIALSGECGLMALQMQRMRETGLMDAMIHSGQ
ncbi:hypothetical protein ILP92_06410 [Maribius pontilimi]|uniref:LTXXQ motif family protein n=1 Tax=Palleronia pontilimi TaxID=1964209 RepID=A0A934IGB6_9RHOB|nr:hypothetical protein [Palleronia pontilimi]MBJ3762373.1 hypothetical protein [Palleronia pontilimi]